MTHFSWEAFAPTTPILVQGITGKEGARMTQWLRQSGMNVRAGVTPGKGGQVVEDCPVFNTVAEACNTYPEIMITSIVVPASRVRGAVEEALAAGIRFVHILTESIPVHDVLAMRAQAGERNAIILGPSSVGYLQFPEFRVGYIGGENPFRLLKPGHVSLISTSGGMVNELMMGLARHGIGIRCAFAVGGDRIPLFSLEDALRVADENPEVEQHVVFAEPGRPFFQLLLEDKVFLKKPLVLFLAGDILDELPRGKAYGHTGTLLQEEEGTVASLRRALREKGISCVATMPELMNYFSTYVHGA
jgi:succinyl-CoA synthetase alpha subunit